MEHKNIFPAEIVEFSTELHYQEHTTHGKVIYQTVLVFLLVGFASLFFINVTVSVNSSGLLTAATERNTVKAPVAGRIERVYVKENQHVTAGSVLLTLQTDALEEQSAYLASRQQELLQRIGDLQLLVAVGEGEKPPLSLRTALYRQQYNVYKQKFREASLRLSNEQNRYNRQKSLYDDKVISDAEFDQIAYEFRNAASRLHLLHDEQISSWQIELNALKLEREELNSQQDKFVREQEFYTVKAPVSGTVQGFTGVRPGSFVTLGETLAELSPDSGLIAEVQVLPRDIGLLRKGMEARLQVDAFNYNEWGVAEARIMDISDDVFLPQNGTPVFLVKCRLNMQKLRLSNGYEGRLKKGMGVQARFLVTRRTLFQLLYDKTDDWLNPASQQGSALSGI